MRKTNYRAKQWPGRNLYKADARQSSLWDFKHKDRLNRFLEADATECWGTGGSYVSLAYAQWVGRLDTHIDVGEKAKQY